MLELIISTAKNNKLVQVENPIPMKSPLSIPVFNLCRRLKNKVNMD